MWCQHAELLCGMYGSASSMIIPVYPW